MARNRPRDAVGTSPPGWCASGWAVPLHAYRNPIRAFEADALTMLVGPDAAGRLLEGAVAAEGIEFVVHAMPAPSMLSR